MQALRNIAIIALLALVVAAVPGGGNLAEGIMALLTIAFLAIIAAAAALVYRRNRLTYMTLPERSRVVLVAALGAIALMVAGADELLGTGAGTLVWLGVMGLAVFALVALWRQSQEL